VSGKLSGIALLVAGALFVLFVLVKALGALGTNRGLTEPVERRVSARRRERLLWASLAEAEDDAEADRIVDDLIELYDGRRRRPDLAAGLRRLRQRSS
jgi:hypothetical protein